jgi:hypothetical protein
MLRLHTRAFFKDYLSIFHTTSYSSTPLAGAIHWGLQFKPLQGGTAGGGVVGKDEEDFILLERATRQCGD